MPAEAVDIYASLDEMSAPEEIARRLSRQVGNDCRLSLDCVVAEVSRDRFLLAARTGADRVMLVLVEGKGPQLRRAAQGSVAIPTPREIYSKRWRPLSAAVWPAATSGEGEAFAVTIRYEYWGGTGAGCFGQDTDFVFLVERRRERFRVLFGALRGVSSHAPSTGDCDGEVLERSGEEAVLRAVPAGDRMRYELSTPGSSAAPLVSVWSSARGSYEPWILYWP